MASLKHTILCPRTFLPKTLLRNNSSVTTATVNSFKKAEVDEENVKPEGWDEAKPFDEIPSLKPLPLIGNNWRFLPGGDFYKVHGLDIPKRLHEKYGRITTLKGLFGVQPMVHLLDPNDFEHVLRNEGPWPIRKNVECVTYYRQRVRPEVYNGVEGVALTQGPEWLRERSIVNKILMQPRTIEMYVGSMNEVANGLLELIRHLAKKDANSEMPDNFQNELYRWTLESVGVVAYNRRIGCLDPNLQKDSDGYQFINAVQQFFELMYQIEYRPSMWRIISTRNWRRFVKIMDFITDINQRYIKECLANVDPNPDIPDHERSALERLAKVDLQIATVMAADMLVAGVDTTGKAIATTLYFISKHPQVQEKLYQEVKNVLPSKDTAVTKEMLNQMPYLRAVFKEGLRMAPVVPRNQRTTVKDLVVAGYQIPKGTNMIQNYALAFWSEKNFPQADQFLPERWLRNKSTNDSFNKSLHPFAYLPFGFGARSCVGKRLANLEVEVGLSKIIRNFKLSWNHPDATFANLALYGIVSPLKIKVQEREN